MYGGKDGSKRALYGDPTPGALCRSPEYDPDLWFPEPGGQAVHARRICNACPALVMCQEYTDKVEANLGPSEIRGVFAGESAAARMRRREKLKRETA